MTQIFIACGTASTIMFFLFFVLPGFDRFTASRNEQQPASPTPALPQTNKAVRANA